MIERPRRLRQSPVLRSLVAETRLHPRDLVLPVFVGEGLTRPHPIASMPGVDQHTLETVVEVARRCVEAGLGGIMLFGVPQHKDATGTGAVDPDGILNVALRAVREAVGDDLVVMADTCLDEFTDHGHCGVIDERGRVDNDATNLLYAEMAVAQARAGAHVVAPSGMMDGQVAVIRESLREIDLDIAEGADMVMVKPAMSYLDVVAAAAERSSVPVAAYQVSGEYSMIQAAAANGWIDLQSAALESLTSIRRAGAQVVLTYFALDVPEWIA